MAGLHNTVVPPPALDTTAPSSASGNETIEARVIGVDTTSSSTFYVVEVHKQQQTTCMRVQLAFAHNNMHAQVLSTVRRSIGSFASSDGSHLFPVGRWTVFRRYSAFATLHTQVLCLGVVCCLHGECRSYFMHAAPHSSSLLRLQQEQSSHHCRQSIAFELALPSSFAIDS